LIDVPEEREGSSRESSSTLQRSETILRSLWSLGTFKTHFFKARTCEISIQGLLLLLPDLLHLHILSHCFLYKQDLGLNFWNPNFSSSKPYLEN
jgi:hypothetical protein